jgi:hypothetical protein
MFETEYLVIDTSGDLTEGTRKPGREVRQAIAAHLPAGNTVRAESGYLPGLTIWCADDFEHGPGLYTNPVADRVIDRLGYRHPSGWYGPVAITMAENSFGDIPPLTPAACATVSELVAAANDEDDVWAPLARHAPELLDEMMFMSNVELDGRQVRQYKHCDTRRYLNLDATGQAWWIAVSEHGRTMARPMPLTEAKSFVCGQDEDE